MQGIVSVDIGGKRGRYQLRTHTPKLWKTQHGEDGMVLSFLVQFVGSCMCFGCLPQMPAHGYSSNFFHSIMGFQYSPSTTPHQF